MVYPMRIVHHICVLDKTRNIRYIKWKSGQEVLDIQVHLNKLECRGKVYFSNSTQILKLVY